jgi:hypothetical protein
MKRKAFANKKAFGIYITADLLIAFGFIVGIVIPAAGWVAGACFIAIGIFLLLKVQKGWKCNACGKLVPDFRIR